MSRPLRVAMLTQAYHPLIGGAERQLKSVAPLLRARDIEVVVVTRRYPGLAPYELVDGVPVHRLPMPRVEALASPVYTAAALPLLRRLRPDVLHAYSLFSPLTTALLAKRMLGAPIAVKVLRGGELGDVARVGRKFSGARRLALARRQVDAFISISAEIGRDLRAAGMPEARLAHIPNGVDTARFAPLTPADKAGLRAALGLPGGPLVIYSGRLYPEKRVQHLCDLWPALREADPDACLLVVGYGPEEAALRRSAPPGVLFTGAVDDVVPYLQAADIYVLPSAAEGLSNSMLEAMSCGLPAIATAVGGAPDVIEHGVNGWLTPPDDLARLGDALRTLLVDARLREALGARGRERVVRAYALDNVAAELRMLYEQILAGQRPVPARVAAARDA